MLLWGKYRRIATLRISNGGKKYDERVGCDFYNFYCRKEGIQRRLMSSHDIQFKEYCFSTSLLNDAL